jgi:hypothetical protein
VKYTKLDLQGNVTEQSSALMFTDIATYAAYRATYEYDSSSRITRATRPTTPTQRWDVGYTYQGDNRATRTWTDPQGVLPQRTEIYHYQEGTNRLVWIHDPIVGVNDCPTATGTGGGHDDNGCRDHGEGLGCHDAGPDQRQRDAGEHGGNGKGNGNGNGDDSSATPDAGASGKLAGGTTCPDGSTPAADRTGMQQDWQRLVDGARQEVHDPEAHFDRSYNNVVGKLNSFLAKYKVHTRALALALFGDQKIHDLWTQIIDRKEANGPRWQESAAEAAARRQAVDDLLAALELLDVRALVAAVESSAADDRCFYYDGAGRLQKEVFTGKKGCDALVPGSQVLCYDHDRWGRVSRIGLSRQPLALDCTNSIPLAQYAYDYRGRRVASTSTLFATTTTFLFDQSARLLAEGLDTDQSSNVLFKQYYWLGDQPLAQLQLAAITAQAGPSCGICAVGTASSAADRRFLGLTALFGALGCILLGARSLRRRDRLGSLRWLLGAATLGFMATAAGSCLKAEPLPTARLYTYYNDHLGTPMLMIGEKLEPVWHNYSEPFGATTAWTDEGATNKLRLPGQYDEQVKLALLSEGPHYNWNRFFDPTTAGYGQVEVLTRNPQTVLQYAARGVPLSSYSYGLSNPVKYVDFDALNPGDRFGSEQSAAIDALEFINPVSIFRNREYGGLICQDRDTGEYFATMPVRGTRASCRPYRARCPSGSRRIAYYHTHAADDPRYNNEDFSRTDRRTADISRDNAWLATPSYQYLQYDWLTGHTSVIGQWVPGPL